MTKQPITKQIHIDWILSFYCVLVKSNHPSYWIHGSKILKGKTLIHITSPTKKKNFLKQKNEPTFYQYSGQAAW